MASALPATLETPLTFRTELLQARNDGQSHSAVLSREIRLLDSGSTPISATLMAVATDHSSDSAGDLRAQRAIEEFERAIVEGTQTDMAARLKAAFRAANAGVYAESPGSLSMVAMVARGKYASFGAVGSNAAVLYRADRLNMVTRNQRSDRSSNRRAHQQASKSEPEMHYLGDQERLESKLPAVFDVTLLPLDVLALVSSDLAARLSGPEDTRALVVPGRSFAASLESQIQSSGDSSAAATVLEVLPVRDELPAPPPAAVATPTYLPYLLIAIVMLAGLLFALWYFFA